MFGPYHLPHLIRYFDGIDLAIANRLLRRVPPSEPTLTEEFCAIMDSQSQRREGLLSFDIEALCTALSAHGDLIDVHFQVDTHQHASWMEAYVSQSDFALVLDYQNTVFPDYNWHSAYLMQAKRLFPDPMTGEYKVTSTFKSSDRLQQKRIRTLARLLGEHAMKFCLYCPPTSGYEERSAGAIRALHTMNLSGQIFDFALGLALRDAIQKSGGIESGMWITDTQNEPSNAAELHKRAFRSAHPLTWFLLLHFDEQPSIPLGMRSFLWKSRPSSPSAEIDRVRRIARGENEAIRTLVEELGEKARKADLDPEVRKILPATSVTIRIRVGPEEGIDL